MKREDHRIWSNADLDLDDWREDLLEEAPDASEIELLEMMYERNEEYLQDERINLNIQFEHPILVIGNLGRWNGRVTGYAEIKALCAGNPHIKEKMDLDIAVQRLRLLKSSFLSQRYALEDRIHREFPQKLAALEQRRTGLQKDIAHRDASTHKNADGFAPMVIDGICITEKKAAGNAILAACQAMTSPDPVPLGQYRGFSMSLSFDSLAKAYVISMKNELTHTVHLGTDIFGNIQRLDNLLDSLGERLQDCVTLLGEIRKQLASAEEQVKKPFPQEEELKTKSQRLDELNRLLNMDKTENEIVDGEVDDTQPEQTRKEQKER